jgi:hypothetical protein
MADQPLLLISTDSQAWDTRVNRRRSVAIKFLLELTQSVAGRPRGLASWPTLVSLCLVVWPHVVYVSHTFL